MDARRSRQRGLRRSSRHPRRSAAAGIPRRDVRAAACGAGTPGPSRGLDGRPCADRAGAGRRRPGRRWSARRRVRPAALCAVVRATGADRPGAAVARVSGAGGRSHRRRDARIVGGGRAAQVRRAGRRRFDGRARARQVLAVGILGVGASLVRPARLRAPGAWRGGFAGNAGRRIRHSRRRLARVPRNGAFRPHRSSRSATRGVARGHERRIRRPCPVDGTVVACRRRAGGGRVAGAVDARAGAQAGAFRPLHRQHGHAFSQRLVPPAKRRHAGARSRVRHAPDGVRARRGRAARAGLRSAAARARARSRVARRRRSGACLLAAGGGRRTRFRAIASQNACEVARALERFVPS